MLNEIKKQSITPSCKANVMDSLQYLAEINREVARLRRGEITEAELSAFLLNRSNQFGYISDLQHTMKVMDEVNQIQV